MREIIPSVWLWLQVCTNAMNFAKDKSYILDKEFAKAGNVTSYQGGPLHNMRRYCPTDLDGGKLTEFVVATFFPVFMCVHAYTGADCCVHVSYADSYLYM